MADAAKKTREQQKEHFATDAMPTSQAFVDLIDSGLNLLDDGLARTPQAVRANRPLHAGEALEVTGPVTATSPVTAQNGLEVQGAAAEVGLVRANRHVTATAGLTVTGRALEVGTATTHRALKVHGPLSAKRLTLGGLSVTRIVDTMSPGADADAALPTRKAIRDHLAATGIANQTTGMLTANGLITAAGGLTVPTGQTLSVDTILPSSSTEWRRDLIIQARGQGRVVLPRPAWEKMPDEPLHCCKDTFGVVHLRGKVEDAGTVTEDGAYKIFRLPREYSPEREVNLTVVAGSSSAAMRITPGGWCLVSSQERPVRLDGLTFDGADPSRILDLAFDGKTRDRSYNEWPLTHYDSQQPAGWVERTRPNRLTNPPEARPYASLGNEYIFIPDLRLPPQFTITIHAEMDGYTNFTELVNLGNTRFFSSRMGHARLGSPALEVAGSHRRVSVQRYRLTAVQGAGGRKIYVDGACAAEDTSKTTIDGAGAYVGVFRDDREPPMASFEFKLFGLQMYDRPLDAHEIGRLSWNDY